MTIGGVRVEDLVRRDVRGDRFWAKVIGEADGGKLTIESLTGRPIPAMHVSARQVVGHWRMRKGSAV